MITVHSVFENKNRWDDYCLVAESCVRGGHAPPIEQCIGLQPNAFGEDRYLASDVIAAYLDTGHARVEIAGEMYDLEHAIRILEGGL